MSTAHACGDWLLTPQGAAVHRATATAVVADLHLGYSETRRAAGEAVPLPDLGRTLAPLGAVASRFGARRLVIAGDLFESAVSPGLLDEVLNRLRQAGLELHGVVPGNHDHRLDGHAARLPLCPEGVRLGRWHVVHGDVELPAGPVVHGHFHPCLRWGGVSAPCFLVGPDRLVLPAFSQDAAGANVLAGPRWRSCRCLVPVADRVLDFGEVGLLRRARRPGPGPPSRLRR
jgi:metallophosphoesterase superfamily enzyme